MRSIKVTPLVYQFLMHSREIFHSYSLRHVRRMHCHVKHPFWKHKFYLRLDDCLSRLCQNESRRIHCHKCRYSVYPYGGLEAFTNIASGFRCLWCLGKALQIKTDSAKIYRHSLVYLVTERGRKSSDKSLSVPQLFMPSTLLVGMEVV